MALLTMTLAADGPTDANLIPIFDWLMRDQFSSVAYRFEFASQNIARRGTLQERVQAALKLFPCDILLVHRDAENQPYLLRHSEIDGAVQGQHSYVVRVVPIRMTEAWLLSNVAAIRAAAKNRNGQTALALPTPDQCERRPNPKADLQDALLQACGLSARRRAIFDLSGAARRVAELTTDYSSLRQLEAFSRFENELAIAIGAWKISSKIE